MRENSKGNFDDLTGILAYFEDAKKEGKKLHPLVGLKNSKNRYVYLSFKDPQTDKRNPDVPCKCSFTVPGIVEAQEKAIKVDNALRVFTSASEFWQWYVENIDTLPIKMDKDRVTYREIFTRLEDQYFNGKHRNTGRKRSRDIKSDLRSFYDSKLRFFNRFPNWDKTLEYDDFHHVLFDFPQAKQGTKTFITCLSVLKAIAIEGNNKSILSKLNKIDSTQTEYRNEQSIDIETFLSRYHIAYNAALNTKNKKERQAKFNWLWVSTMAVMYGLRPSEIAAAKNLFSDITIIQKSGNKYEIIEGYFPDKGDTFYRYDNPKNVDLALVIGEFTYFGASTKTGLRDCYPIPSKKMQNELRLIQINLPITKTDNPDRFAANFSKWSLRNLGISQDYAFRHLYNALAKMYGLPPEIRSLNMGHSMKVNLERYNRNDRNFKSRKQMIKGKYALSLDAAISELNHLGIDCELPEIKLILKVIYQLDK